MQKWVIYFDRGGIPITHYGHIEERNGVFYCYKDSDLKYIVPTRHVEYIICDD